MTNGDRIRQMSNEELAKIFVKSDTCEICIYNAHISCLHKDCEGGIKAYLESEVE